MILSGPLLRWWSLSGPTEEPGPSPALKQSLPSSLVNGVVQRGPLYYPMQYTVGVFIGYEGSDSDSRFRGEMARTRELGLLKLLLLLLLLEAVATSVKAHGGSHDEDSDSEPVVTNLRSRSLVVTKVWCLIIAFVATFAAGMSPYFFRWHSGFLVLGTQFAGGVFLATALIHFLADANEEFKSLTKKEYPFAFMLATAGYLVTMLADCVIESVYSKSARTTAAIDREERGVKEEAGDERPRHVIVAAPSLVREASWSDSLLLILALCFHSVFEGIAIGVSATERDAWRNLWTICLHKLFAAIAMGIALLKIMPTRPLLSSTLYALAFAISTPIGVAIGIIIDATTEGPVADWVYAISMGIACGVFVYVAINHLLARGFVPDKPTLADLPLLRFLAVATGAAVIAIVLIWD